MSEESIAVSHIECKKGRALLLSIHPAATAQKSIGAFANDHIAAHGDNFILLSTAGAVSPDQARHALTMLIGSNTVRALVFHSHAMLAMTRGAWEQLKGFGAGTWPELLSDIVARSKEARLFAICEFHQPLITNVEQPQVVEVAAKPQSAAPAPIAKTIVVERLYTPEDLIRMIDDAVAQLNSNKNEAALDILRTVIPHKCDMPVLFYAQAVAEVRLGRFNEATCSLKKLLLADPQHLQAKALFEQIQSDRRA